MWFNKEKIKEKMKSSYSVEVTKFRCDGIITTVPRKPNNFYTITWDETQIKIAMDRFMLESHDINKTVQATAENRQLLRRAREVNDNKANTSDATTAPNPEPSLTTQ